MQQRTLRTLLCLSLIATTAIGIGYYMPTVDIEAKENETALLAAATTPAGQDGVPYPDMTKPNISSITSRSINTNTIKALLANQSGPKPGFAGYYLAGRHAQIHQDWASASSYFDLVSGKDPRNEMLQRRTMVVAIGGGDIDLAVRHAHQIIEKTPDDPLSQLFLAAHAIKNNKFITASEHLDSMKPGGMANFVSPLLNAWISASHDDFNIEDLHYDPVHIYHIALIGKLTNNENKAYAHINTKLKKGYLTPSIRLGDSLLILGKTKEAEEIYTQIPQNQTNTALINRRLAALRNNSFSSLPFNAPKDIQSGFALAFLDLARVLHTQNSIDSARVFAYISREINPELIETKIFLAQLFMDSDRSDFAIQILETIPVDSPYYEETQIRIASLLEDNGETEKAIQTLKSYLSSHPSTDARIFLADLYRRVGALDTALQTYNDVLSQYTDAVPDDKWHLFYSRGIVLEQIGEWEKAEADFEKALGYRPNDPYILNYLGYGWVTRNIQLQKSLEYIEKAAKEAPYDGHVIDSLGWVLFKLGRYKEAVPALEKAISYLPYDAIVNEHLGDAYWMTGREREARFQWKRAYNHLDKTDTETRASLKQKIMNGIDNVPVIAAQNETSEIESHTETIAQ